MTTVLGNEIALTWEPNTETDLAGYVVRYGSSSGNHSKSVEAGNKTSIKLQGLAPGTYYSVVVAKSASGIESPPSDEVKFDVISLEAPALANLVDGQSLNGPAPITLQAPVFGADVVRVELYAGDVKIGEIRSATESATWQPAKAGDYTITAKAYDGANRVANATLDIHIVQPAIEDLSYGQDGSLEVAVKGAPGRSQRVEVSDDLRTWTPLESKVNTTGEMVVRDAQTPQKKKRFYRLISE